jgi:hypothetical protein
MGPLFVLVVLPAPEGLRRSSAGPQNRRDAWSGGGAGADGAGPCGRGRRPLAFGAGCEMRALSQRQLLSRHEAAACSRSGHCRSPWTPVRRRFFNTCGLPRGPRARLNSHCVNELRRTFPHHRDTASASGPSGALRACPLPFPIPPAKANRGPAAVNPQTPMP